MIKEKEYKGHPVLCILEHEEESKPLSFGIHKAKLILGHIPEIIEFVNKYSVVNSKNFL